MSTPAIAVIAAAQNAAQAIEDLLRNAGHDLRVQWLENAAAIENRTEIDPAGVICVHQTNIQSLESVIAECTRANTASLVIALAPTSSRLAVLEAGAWDAADPSEPALLTQALERALRGVAARQELIETRAALARTQMRLDTMLRESLDARATIEDGLHAQTTPGYARLFGFDE
ncbi:MAG: hypothetical protein L0H83_09220, partial [Salinisphaera sp.]|nr:hypothetical protein [Salinisphaera sp.]